MGSLIKIYRFLQAGRCLFNIFCDDKFEQTQADLRVCHKIDDDEVEKVLFMDLDDILADVQETMESFAKDIQASSREQKSPTSIPQRGNDKNK